MCSRSKMEKKRSLDKESCISLYTKKKLGFHSKMGLIYCLMGFEVGCKSTPNNKSPKFVERDEVDLYEFYE
ncbi:hypothetical protein YC2023_024059 [Brassica napus]